MLNFYALGTRPENLERGNKSIRSVPVHNWYLLDQPHLVDLKLGM